MTALIILAAVAIVTGVLVWTAVMFGGLKLTKDHLQEERPDVPDEDLEPLPTDVQY